MAGGRCKSKNASAGAGQLHLPAIDALATALASEQVYVGEDVAVTPLQQRGGCAGGSVQRKGQALARRSDLCAMPAQPCFHIMMLGCLRGVWSILPHIHVDPKSHIQMQARTAHFRPGLSQVIGACVCVCAYVCVISCTPSSRLQLGL